MTFDPLKWRPSPYNNPYGLRSIDDLSSELIKKYRTGDKDLYLLDRFTTKGNKGYNPLDGEIHYDEDKCYKCGDKTTLRNFDNKPMCKKCKDNFYKQRELEEQLEKIKEEIRSINERIDEEDKLINQYRGNNWEFYYASKDTKNNLKDERAELREKRDSLQSEINKLK